MNKKSRSVAGLMRVVPGLIVLFVAAAFFFTACDEVSITYPEPAPPRPMCQHDPDPGEGWPTTVDCLKCYRWWSAVILEVAINYATLSDSPESEQYIDEIKKIPHLFLKQSPFTTLDHTGWPNLQLIDDHMWYGLAYIRAYEWLKDHPEYEVEPEKYLEQAKRMFNDWYRVGLDKKCGGVWWECDISSGPPPPPYTCSVKGAIEILQTMALGARIALALKDPESCYARVAEDLWTYVSHPQSYTPQGPGFISLDGLIFDHAVQTSQNTCEYHPANPSETYFSYNQGMYFGAAVSLWKLSKMAGKQNDQYIEKGKAVLDAVLEHYGDKVLSMDSQLKPPYVIGDKACTSEPSDPSDPSDPLGLDAFVFKGIFMTQLQYFLEGAEEVLSADDYNRYQAFIGSNINEIENNARKDPPIAAPLDNFCFDSKVELKAGDPPFFLFWWDTPPPDLTHVCMDVRTQISALAAYIAGMSANIAGAADKADSAMGGLQKYFYAGQGLGYWQNCDEFGQYDCVCNKPPWG